MAACTRCGGKASSDGNAPSFRPGAEEPGRDTGATVADVGPGFASAAAQSLQATRGIFVLGHRAARGRFMGGIKRGFEHVRDRINNALRHSRSSAPFGRVAALRTAPVPVPGTR